jgi:hypothetical protein
METNAGKIQRRCNGLFLMRGLCQIASPGSKVNPFFRLDSMLKSCAVVFLQHSAADRALCAFFGNII